MTVDQLVKPLRLVSDVQQRRLAGAVVTPEIRKAVQDASAQSAQILGTRLREQLRSQIEFQKMFRPALLEQIREQNAALRQVLDTPGIRRAMANVDFNLPEGLAGQIVAFREQLAAEMADPGIAEEAAGRLAQERGAIIKCLRRVGLAVEGFSYLPESPLPPLIGFLILLLAALGEVADEILTEREDDD